MTATMACVFQERSLESRPIRMLQIKLGDPTMSVLEIWGAEYQENDCVLLKQEDRPAFEAICARERCSMQVR